MKSYKIQLPVLLSLVVLNQFLYQQISLLQISRTLFNIDLKKDFHHKFSFLTDSAKPRHPLTAKIR